MLIMKVFVRSADNNNSSSYFNSELSTTTKHKIISVNLKEKIKITTTITIASVKYINIFMLLAMLLLITATGARAAPHAVSDNRNTTTPWSSSATSSLNLNRNFWPAMKHYDIWNDDKRNIKLNDYVEENNEMSVKESEELLYNETSSNAISSKENFLKTLVQNGIDLKQIEQFVNNTKRQSKVIHLFPVPVDGECLSDDGRRIGTCFNAYECRNKGGEAKGECGLGFGVCCIFIANCNETISNNITYLVSPNFPSFMPNNITNCSLKVKLMNDDISQLRIDFYHFILGQPNRRTGVCDGDVFSVSGGPGGTISICGQNSGQHMYYDVGGRMLPRQTLYGTVRPLRYEDLYPGRNNTNDTSMELDIKLNFAPRFLPTRLWEIRISQIPFSQRAPAGCLQYFTGTEGVFQTFNFADNGRHLANQNYRICMRQEMDMCSIIYQPCDEESFRIGPSSSQGVFSGTNNQFTGTNDISNMPLNDDPEIVDNDVMQLINQQQMNTTQMTSLQDDPTNDQMGMTSTTVSNMQLMQNVTSTTVVTETTTTTAAPVSSTTETTTTTTAMDSSTASSLADDPEEISSTASTTVSTTTQALNDDVEGSGDDYDYEASDNSNINFRPTPSSGNVSRKPRPTSGGFDLLGFLRSAFDFGFRSSRKIKSLNERQMRQFFSNCRDRITMPCIVEDFIGTGLGPLPGCEPVHCGMQFCSNGIWPCRIESTVTPFYVGIHFGDGVGKGSPEDNIGACLRYEQVQCM